MNNRNDARLVRSQISTWDSHSSTDTVGKISCDRKCLLNRVSLSLFWIILSLFWHGAHYQIRYSWLFVLSPCEPRWEKSLECISGAKIFFLAFAMKFILHARILLLLSPFSLMPKQDCKRARAWISHGQFFTMKTSQAIWRLGRGGGVDLIYVRRLAL